MSRCRGFKKDGTQCTQTVNPQQDFCWWHDPVNSDKRRSTAAKGGKGKAGKVTKTLHELLEDLTTRVVDGKLEPYRASVAGQLVRTRIQLLEFERSVREAEELEARLEELETLAENTRPSRRAGRPWHDGIG